MTVDVTLPITDYAGTPILNSNKEPYTVRDAIVISLNNGPANPSGQPELLTSEQKSKIFQLSVKMWAGKDVELTLDDRAFIKERASKSLSSLEYGRVCEVLEDPKKEGPKA